MSTMLFQKVEPVSKKARVVALLKEAILSGVIQSGEQIVEGKIAQQFGVGQGLIREALIELEHHGFVIRTPFSGTQVPKLGLEDAQQIFDIRICLEPLAVELAGQKATPAQLAEMQDLVVKAKEAMTDAVAEAKAAVEAAMKESLDTLPNSSAPAPNPLRP